MKYFLLLISMSLAVVAQMLLKRGISQSSLSPNFLSIVQTILSPAVFFGFVIYGLSSIFWLFVLQKFPLSVAYPSLAMTYIVVLFLSVMFYGEMLSATKLVAVFLIFSGVVLLNR